MRSAVSPKAVAIAVLVAVLTVPGPSAGQGRAADEATKSWTRTLELDLTARQLDLPRGTPPRQLARAALGRRARRLGLDPSLEGVRLSRELRLAGGPGGARRQRSLRFQQTVGRRRVVWSQIDGGGFYVAFEQRVYLSPLTGYKNDVIAHELGHHIDHVFSDDRIAADNEAKEVGEALADMFAYDFDREDASLGEDGGSGGASRNWANPGSIRHPNGLPFPDRMSEYRCGAEVHFNGTILSHAYYRFAQKVGHPVAGYILQYIPWFLGPRGRFEDVARGFEARAAGLYPSNPSVAAAARQAFRTEVGVSAPRC